MANKVTLFGRLRENPDVTVSPTGARKVYFTLITTEHWQDKSGKQMEHREHHRCFTWNKAAGEYALNYLRAESMAYIEGQIKSREYQDANGYSARMFEIQVNKIEGVYDGRPAAIPSAGPMPSAGSFNSNFADPEKDLPF